MGNIKHEHPPPAVAPHGYILPIAPSTRAGNHLLALTNVPAALIGFPSQDMFTGTYASPGVTHTKQLVGKTAQMTHVGMPGFFTPAVRLLLPPAVQPYGIAAVAATTDSFRRYLNDPSGALNVRNREKRKHMPIKTQRSNDTRRNAIREERRHEGGCSLPAGESNTPGLRDATVGSL